MTLLKIKGLLGVLYFTEYSLIDLGLSSGNLWCDKNFPGALKFKKDYAPVANLSTPNKKDYMELVTSTEIESISEKEVTLRSLKNQNKLTFPLGSDNKLFWCDIEKDLLGLKLPTNCGAAVLVLPSLLCLSLDYTKEELPYRFIFKG